MKNKMLEKALFATVGMSNVLLKQAEDLLVAIDGLNKYSNEDIREATEKMLEINKKLCELKKVY